MNLTITHVPVKHGARPYRPKLRDWDFIPTFYPEIHAGTAQYPQFPAEYLTDHLNWMPDQNAEGQPTGCTNYSTVRLARILGILEATVEKLEAVTHANALGGFGVIASLDAARQTLKWFGARFIIHATGILDYFDAMRLAQMNGVPEKRAITWGTPWFPSWAEAIARGQRIMPIPTLDELRRAHQNPNSFLWHDHVPDGWSQNFPVAPGQLLYRSFSHQGPYVGYIYFDRSIINAVQDLYGTVAATATSTRPAAFTTISLPEWFWSLYHSWFAFSY